MGDITSLRHLHDQQAWAALQDEARLANHLQADYPTMTRTNALREAARLVGKHGLGLTLAPVQETHQQRIERVRPAVPCSAHHVLAGGQCGNCLWHPEARSWLAR